VGNQYRGYWLRQASGTGSWQLWDTRIAVYGSIQALADQAD
jgi:hypothetical protein